MAAIIIRQVSRAPTSPADQLGVGPLEARFIANRSLRSGRTGAFARKLDCEYIRFKESQAAQRAARMHWPSRLPPPFR
jgi:hypothetical protein